VENQRFFASGVRKKPGPVEFVRPEGNAPPNCVTREAKEEVLISTVTAERFENPESGLVLLLI